MLYSAYFVFWIGCNVAKKNRLVPFVAMVGSGLNIGLNLLLLGILEGFAGYSLPDDLLSGTGLRIADAEDDAVHADVGERTGAHGAGFLGDIEGCI